MLNDFFDDRKNQCCVQVWNFKVDPPYFGNDADFLAKNSQFLPMYTKSK
jgi:hypothetical protein